MTCTDIDGCDPDPCDANAQCTDNTAPDTGATCTCSTGYEGDGMTCTAVDYCSSGPCLNGGTCEDDGNGYTCTCAPNYDGVHCEIGCEDGYWLYNNTCYWFSPTWHEYSDAEDVCAARNAIMATVKDAGTHSFLSTQIQSTQDGKSHWIGLTDRINDGNYKWSDGSTPGSYQPFAGPVSSGLATTPRRVASSCGTM
ncbi:VCAN [Branchiostoma lanceolatum]|uniref:VCAN protein n=1 Tax=Branchiostoma lanceolatum TaxID=7740 RepID=A0A8J9ZJG2_BRALA|nr:VCAN [Branchiostoma lanceolatum]